MNKVQPFRICARCIAGAFGIDSSGEAKWVADFDYLVSFRWENGRLFLNDIEISRQTGLEVARPKA
jgi:hypothetical protein